MTDDKLSKIDNKTLDLMETGHGLTKKEAEELCVDAEVKAQCAEVEAIATAMRMEREPVDVEQELKRFHERIANKPVSQSFTSNESVSNQTLRGLRLGGMVAGLAAAILAAIFLIGKPTIKHKTPSPNSQRLVYVASAKPADIVLRGGSIGETVITARKPSQPVAVEQIVPGIDTTHTRDICLNVPEGKTLAIALPDGSRVWLHPGSTIYFPTRFPANARQVKLVGEAYFQVARDTSRPFTVEAASMRTTVLGTEFNISTYGNNGPEVVLVSGSVKAQAANSHTILTPGTQATATSHGIVTRTVDTGKYTNWRDGYFYFDNEPLTAILQEIGRNYGITVICDNPALRQARLHFVARRDETLTGILARLQDLAHVGVCRNGKTVTVVPTLAKPQQH